jgi:predicted transcriptional regulator
MKNLNVCGIEIIVENNLDVFIPNNIDGTTTVTIKVGATKEKKEKVSITEEGFALLLNAIDACDRKGALSSWANLKDRRPTLKDPAFKNIVERMIADGLIEERKSTNRKTYYVITAKGKAIYE